MTIFIIIFVFLVALIFSAYFHIQQNKKLSRYCEQHVNADAAQWLTQFAWSRTLQLLSALGAGLMVTLLLYSFELEKHNETLKTLQLNMGNKIQELVSAQQETSQNLSRLSASVPAASSTTTVNTIPATRIPQVAVTAPVMPSVTPAETTSSAEQPSKLPASAQETLSALHNETMPGGQAETDSGAKPVTVSDVYNPEENAMDNQSEMDAIKKRYEGLLVNYLFLKKCNLINPKDYHTILSTMAREMSSINAPSRLEHDILTAAQGSYNEMYSQSKCDAPETAALQQQYDDYIKTISENIPTE